MPPGSPGQGSTLGAEVKDPRTVVAFSSRAPDMPGRGARARARAPAATGQPPRSCGAAPTGPP
ncbi:hypothetical protein COCSUDRAFT_62724 [Coccomyxa subellipsoidea C-169]|uniref:Uncharacterized protein n=1 Tax=Coccomyxa subellipsoidea (strain C-169) TaxID=574566 RepID=I0Z0P7_COCSC|nr:hypothetical protein COCSUDRAFT_62724 [Coccomyxa subellipsoidea C-169]EIE24216.1 hypothetical protein COCSUDRAFT_62724 [Coccomyxa subellipsoidea C-169]|eukprot:XP_005648760.1 hypothetical protein COCSUDRAFT_62724 [Coccomyxa subellipsoidea C-169]